MLGLFFVVTENLQSTYVGFDRRLTVGIGLTFGSFWRVTKLLGDGRGIWFYFMRKFPLAPLRMMKVHWPAKACI